MTDLHADLTARWCPSVEQIAAAERVIEEMRQLGTPDAEPVYTLHLLADKTYGFWTAGVTVIHLPGVYPKRGLALDALVVATTKWRQANPGRKCSGGYAAHWVDNWAVFEDILAAGR